MHRQSDLPLKPFRAPAHRLAPRLLPTACALSLLTAATPAFAASIFMDEAGLSWLTPSVWANNAAPSAANDYFLRADVGATSVRGTMLTSPAGTTANGSANFTGSSLEASELTTLVVKQRGTETLAIRGGNGDLKLSGGTIRFDPNQGGSTPVFDMDRFLFDDGTHFIEVSSFTIRITFDGVLSGNGELVLLAKRNSFPAGNVVTFTEVNNTALTGTISVNNGIVLDFGSDVSPAATIEMEDTAQLQVDQIIRLGSGRLTDPVNGTVPDGIYLGPSLAALGANYVGGGGALIVGTGGALPVFTVTTLADELDAPVGAGAGLSLREALGLAVLGRIEFAPALDGGAIQLDATRGPLAIRTSVTIDASALPSGLTIDGGSNGDDADDAGETRCLLIDDGNADNLLAVVLRGLTVRNGVFTATASEAGGNIHNREHLTLENCRVLGGRALGSSAKGGGVYSASRSRLTIVDCTLSGNRATGSGGGVYFECEATINGNALAFAMSGTTVSGNISGGLGGGLFHAGPIAASGQRSLFTSCTIAGNRTTARDGGGFLNVNGSQLDLVNSIVAGNTGAGTGPDIDGGFTSGGVNFVGVTGGSSGFRNGTDRSFANTGSTLATLLATTAGSPLLADNGGPTPTVMLVAGSPANNAGDNAAIRAGAGDLIVDGGTIAFGTTSNTRVNTPRLDVNDFHITTTPGALLTLNVAAQTATIDGRLAGPGDLRIEAEGDSTLPGHTAVLTAVDEDGYAGTITVAESLVLDFETNVFFRAGGGVTLLGASRLRVDQLLAFRVGRLVDPVNGPVPAGVYLPGQLAVLGTNYIDAGGAIVVSDHLDDTDADGLPDFFEFFIIDANPTDAVDGLDDVAGPLDASETDFNQDGLNDAEEFLAGPTIPIDPDSDDDGLLDGAEIAGTDNAGNPTGAGPTHPLRADTDGDGFTDGAEVAAGTDPNDAESQPAPREIVAVSIVPTVVNGVITRMDITYKNLDTTRTYYLERTLDLVTFYTVVDTHAPAAETDTYSDANPPASPRLFYRLVRLD